MRLDKAIAQNGLTRQMAKKAIAGGRARVNGRVVLDPGYLLKPEDEVLLDGENARAPENVHLMLHKPAGCLTATEDARGGSRCSTFCRRKSACAGSARWGGWIRT